jgi:hypothetical protein
MHSQDLSKHSALDHIEITDDTGEVLLHQRGTTQKAGFETGHPKMEGFVSIKDAETGEVILDKKNAIHYENMSHCIALTMSHQGYGHIHKLVFGNGASTVTGTGAISYFPPNTTGSEAGLYNMTYDAKVVDANSVLNSYPERNYVEVSHVENQTYTDLIVHCFLDYSEPNGQEAFDDSADNEGNFVFDEIGLVSYPKNGEGPGKLLTHCIFHPLQKSLNRSFEIKYTVRIYMSA